MTPFYSLPTLTIPQIKTVATRKAYAYTSSEKQVLHKGEWLKAKRLTITFEEPNTNVSLRYRLANGKEINWWACVSDDIPKNEIIECSDGLFLWNEVWSTDETGFEDCACGFIIMNKIETTL